MNKRHFVFDYDKARKFRLKDLHGKTPDVSLGDRMADSVASMVGSWRFIIIQSILLFGWIVLNVVAWVKAWDPYPFILLNLVLSFQAAFTAPIIMMSQNRQSDVDRKKAEIDYGVNVKAEADIESLHTKFDLMREKDIAHLITLLDTVIEENRALRDEINDLRNKP
ncbi:MAG: DUF1003 domain-containing protein [Asticcacaulis sp.]